MSAGPVVGIPASPESVVMDSRVASPKSMTFMCCPSVIDDPATQLAFSRAKGSVPVVRDVDVSSLTGYQRASSQALWSLPVLLSIAHGEAIEPGVPGGLLRRGVDVRPHTGRGRIRRRPRGRGLQRQDTRALTKDEVLQKIGVVDWGSPHVEARGALEPSTALPDTTREGE